MERYLTAVIVLMASRGGVGDVAMQIEISDVCTSAECVITASDFLQSMNMDQDPCEDFFEFACGGWIKSHPIADSQSSSTQFEMAINRLLDLLKDENDARDCDALRKARKMFNVCMDHEQSERNALQPITQFLDLFGGWPMTVTCWQNTSHWIHMITAAKQLFDVNYLISLHISADTNNTHHNSIHIDQASLALPRSTLLHKFENAAVMDAYVDFMTQSAQAIRNSINSTVTDKEIADDVQDTVKFEIELAKILISEEERRNDTRVYNPFVLDDLQKWTDAIGASSPQANIDWVDYLQSLYAVANISITSDERVIVLEPEYLRNLVQLLDSTAPRTIANYIHWRLVFDVAGLTNQQMANIAFNFAKVSYGVSEMEPRAKICLSNVNDLLGFALSSKYIQDHFNQSVKAEVQTMISNLKKSFKSLIDANQWMDNETKKRAKNKVDRMIQRVAHPDWILNETLVNDYYQELVIGNRSHLENIQNVNYFLFVKYAKNLRNRTDSTAWSFAPTVVNGFYEPEYNAISFTAGIFQAPFYRGSTLAAINYGAIGAIIGHEITHGFDDQGRQRDENGNTVQWWTEATLSNYLSRTQCFIDQYSNYSVYPGLYVDGINTQGENIADNGGLRQAFQAYQLYVSEHGVEPSLPGLDQFSADQLFFISFANSCCGVDRRAQHEHRILTDVHSPERFRILGPISNSQDFARLFNCPVGSAMNPVDKCILW